MTRTRSSGRPIVSANVAAGVASCAPTPAAPANSAATTATTVLAGASPASAAPAQPTTQADVIGVVKVDKSDPTVATFQARYRCTGEGTLWVSVKQTADRTADPALAQPESSGVSAAMSHSHRNAVTCNGKWRVDTFTVDQVEWGFGALAKGEGYVQFCLFDATTGEMPLSQNEFLHVR